MELFANCMSVLFVFLLCSLPSDVYTFHWFGLCLKLVSGYALEHDLVVGMPKDGVSAAELAKSTQILLVTRVTDDVIVYLDPTVLVLNASFDTCLCQGIG